MARNRNTTVLQTDSLINNLGVDDSTEVNVGSDLLIRIPCCVFLLKHGGGCCWVSWYVSS